jgi:hypothetical protein
MNMRLRRKRKRVGRVVQKLHLCCCGSFSERSLEEEEEVGYHKKDGVWIGIETLIELGLK